MRRARRRLKSEASHEGAGGCRVEGVAAEGASAGGLITRFWLSSSRKCEYFGAGQKNGGLLRKSDGWMADLIFGGPRR